MIEIDPGEILASACLVIIVLTGLAALVDGDWLAVGFSVGAAAIVLAGWEARTQ